MLSFVEVSLRRPDRSRKRLNRDVKQHSGQDFWEDLEQSELEGEIHCSRFLLELRQKDQDVCPPGQDGRSFILYHLVRTGSASKALEKEGAWWKGRRYPTSCITRCHFRVNRS
jgi:hypothetical protein